jgi:hypothetical protein
VFSQLAHGLDFKGVELGKQISFEKLHEVANVSCEPHSLPESGVKTYCTGYTTIAGVNAQISLHILAGDVVGYVALQFPPQGYGTVEEALIARYGQPVRVRLPNGQFLGPKWPFKDGSYIQATRQNFFFGGNSTVDFYPPERRIEDRINDL